MKKFKIIGSYFLIIIGSIIFISGAIYSLSKELTSFFESFSLMLASTIPGLTLVIIGAIYYDNIKESDKNEKTK